MLPRLAVVATKGYRAVVRRSPSRLPCYSSWLEVLEGVFQFWEWPGSTLAQKTPYRHTHSARYLSAFAGVMGCSGSVQMLGIRAVCPKNAARPRHHSVKTEQLDWPRLAGNIDSAAPRESGSVVIQYPHAPISHESCSDPKAYRTDKMVLPATETKTVVAVKHHRHSSESAVGAVGDLGQAESFLGW